MMVATNNSQLHSSLVLFKSLSPLKRGHAISQTTRNCTKHQWCRYLDQAIQFFFYTVQNVIQRLLYLWHIFVNSEAKDSKIYKKSKIISRGEEETIYLSWSADQTVRSSTHPVFINHEQKVKHRGHNPQKNSLAAGGWTIEKVESNIYLNLREVQWSRKWPYKRRIAGDTLGSVRYRAGVQNTRHVLQLCPAGAITTIDEGSRSSAENIYLKGPQKKKTS